ncbi:MAG: cyclic pyranopterin monophosphate synthase MoaC [Candidatus Hodarchaeales archaeon]
MTVDISSKVAQKRYSSAKGTLTLSQESIERVISKTVQKGDPIENAKLAAIHAVKKTPDLVFMAHPIPIEGIKTDIRIDKDKCSITMRVEVSTIAKTGVEIEALAGVMNGLLAIFDMVKMYEKDTKGNYRTSTRIENVYVESKKKG